jgi:phosphotransferase system enzyme I (PtsP)
VALTDPGLDHGSAAKARLDGVLELMRIVATPRPLTVTLDILPGCIARIFDAEVCSIYLVEGKQLVLRGNVGFPEQALKDIALGAGEGITGLAVELQRPIALAEACGHDAFRLFPELGEERFQSFLATPIFGATAPLGALVLQRAHGEDFGPSDVALAVSLTAPISAAVERAKLIESLSVQGRRVGHGTRRVTLSGRTAVRGKAVGRLWLMPRPTDDLTGPGGDEASSALDEATAEMRRQLELLAQRATSLRADPAPLADLTQMLDDTRLFKRVLKLCSERALCLPRALCSAGAESLRAATRGQDSYGIERATMLSDLCEGLAMLSAGQPAGALPRQPVMAGERLTLHDALLATRVAPAALVLRDRPAPTRGADSHRGLESLLLRLLGVPAIVGIEALFRWAYDGDLLLVDADHGLLRVNPSRAEVALARDQRRRDQPRDPAELAQRTD